jgi:hypothetical protein
MPDLQNLLLLVSRNHGHFGTPALTHPGYRQSWTERLDLSLLLDQIASHMILDHRKYVKQGPDVSKRVEG